MDESDRNSQQLLDQMVALIPTHDPSSEDVATSLERVRSRLGQETDQPHTSPIAVSPSRTVLRFVRWGAIAAVIGVVIFGGHSLWMPQHKQAHPKGWWESPASAWAADVEQALLSAAAAGVICRERTMFVGVEGSSSESSTWDTLYISKDSYRRDIYDGSKLREIQWYTPDHEGRTQHTSVRYDTHSYFAPRPGEGRYGVEEPLERMRFYVRLLDKADRTLPPQVIEGKQCVGFEIHANKYGSNPDTWVDRIWFDTATKLPLRIEQAGRPVTDQPFLTFTTIQDDFRYNPQLPPVTFTPDIPSDFRNTHPDELVNP